MSQNDVKLLNKKLRYLQKLIFKDLTMEEYADGLSLAYEYSGEFYVPFAVFFTISNSVSRIKVFHGSGESLKDAWDNTTNAAHAYLKKNDYEPKWVKVEIVNNVAIEPVARAVDEMFMSYNYYYRMGLSLDMNFRYAFTEGEINGFKLINYKKKNVDMNTLNDYLMYRDNDVMISQPKKVLVFDTLQYFCDDQNKTYELYNQGADTGRRKFEDGIGDDDVFDVIKGLATYLKKQIHNDGKFEYGFFALSHKPLSGYNMLRHTSSIWALTCADEYLRDSDIYNGSKKAIGYMLSQIVHCDGYAYMKDKDEIKLGAGASAIVMLTEYMRVYDTDEYTDLCIELGEGILRLFDEETGIFTHVLDASDMSVKDEFRTVFYDGEATFGLLRLYGLTKDERYLKAAARSVDHFIDADYSKFKDHWVAYSVNELTKYMPEEKYFTFGLYNAQVNLQRIHNQATSYNVFLELLVATYEMYDRILKNGYEVKALDVFDEKYFIETIFHRAEFMLNNYGYPELIMYFLKPNYFKGAYSIRQDSFRTRIDDAQHSCGGYVLLYRNFDSILDRYEEICK